MAMLPSGLQKHLLSPQQILDGLGAIALSISQTQSLDYILKTATQKVRELLETDRVLILRFQADGSGVVVVESVGDRFPAILNQNIHDPCFQSHWNQLYRLGRLSAIADIDTSNTPPCYLKLLAKFQVRANLVVPILQYSPKSEAEMQHPISSLTNTETEENCSASQSQNKLWGLLITHQCSGPRQWQKLEQELLKQLAVLIGLAIQQEKAYEQFHAELALRQQAEKSLRELLQELELRVETRTKELSQINEQLQQEIAERQRVETRNALLATAVEYAGDAIYISDFDANLQYANPAAEKITGYTQAEILGKTPASLFRSSYHSEEFYQAMFDTIASGQVWRGNLIAQRKDNSLCYQEATISPVRDRTGKFTNVVAVKRDVTLGLQAQKALQESEEQFRTSVENLLDCFGIYRSIRDSNGNIIDFLIEYINQAACVNNRMTKEEQIGKRLGELFPVYTERGLFEAYCQVVETGQPLVKESVVYTDIYNGESLSRVFDLQVVKLGDGFAATWRDVTERQQVQQQIQASLQEKETLLKEIHHRVKNNLQVICSLVRLQSRQIKDTQALELFKESQNRVLAMALIHEKLYQSSNLTQIDFQAYIKSLVQELCRSYAVCKSGVIFKVKVNQLGEDSQNTSPLGQITSSPHPTLLAIDTAIPCGLIINELVSNSLKYAFPDNHRGEICITFQESASGQLSLTISDNGIGLPSNLDFRNTQSLGLQLVCRLTKQIEGTIELSRNPGTEFKIAFTEPKLIDRKG